MEDPLVAAHELADDVASGEATYEVPDGSLDAGPDEGWIAVGGVVRSPARERIVLVRTEWSDGWVLPGGSVEPEDDSLEAALRREVREETGLAVAVGEPLLVERQTLVSDTRSSTGWFVVFAADAEGEALATAPGEHEEEIEAVAWFDEVADAFAGPSDLVTEVVERELEPG